MNTLSLQQIPIGAENLGIGADDLEELASDEDEYFRLGSQDESYKDYSSLKLKADHQNRCGCCADCNSGVFLSM